MSNPEGKSLRDFQEYERLMVETTEIITLARAIRRSDLSTVDTKKQTVVVSHFGLSLGKTEAEMISKTMTEGHSTFPPGMVDEREDGPHKDSER